MQGFLLALIRANRKVNIQLQTHFKQRPIVVLHEIKLFQTKSHLKQFSSMLRKKRKKTHQKKFNVPKTHRSQRRNGRLALNRVAELQIVNISKFSNDCFSVGVGQESKENSLCCHPLFHLRGITEALSA